MGKSKILFEIKVEAVEDYLKGLRTVRKISNALSVSISTVEAWIRIYRSKGELGLLPKSNYTGYSKELKITAENHW